MFNIERWQEIFEAISKNKLRTFLTGLSVSSGIFILIILLGVAEGLKKGIKKQFEQDIPTKIQIFPGTTSKGFKGLNPNRRIKFNTSDYAHVTEKYKPEIQYQATNLVKYGGVTTYEDKNGNYILYGTMPDNLFLANAYLIAGRFISEKDLKNKAKVVVLGQRPIKDLFDGDYKAAIGKIISINSIKFKVIGVYEDNGGERQDTYMYIPHSTITRIYNLTNDIGRMEFTLNPIEDYTTALNKAEDFAQRVTNQLKAKYSVHPDDLKGVRYYNALEGGKSFYMLNFGLKIFFWGIGILTLISGIVGVSNIMLIIVKERTKEIGIRKALGAQPKAIVNMILHESIFITIISGLIGLFAGIIILDIINNNLEIEFLLNPTVPFNVAVITLIILIIAGAIAGYIPARHASKIKPIVALRDE